MKRSWIAALALLATASAWGATFTLVKNVLAKIDPAPFIFILVAMLVSQLPDRRPTESANSRS